MVSTHYPSDDAIGEYCGHVAAELCKQANVIVLANTSPGSPVCSRIQSQDRSCNYTVLRIWKAGLFYPFTVFRNIIQEKPDIVHIQHEYFMYGTGYRAVLFPTILLLLRMTRIPLVVTMHHVIPRRANRHFKKLLRTAIPEVLISVFLTCFNRLFSFSSKIIVPSTTFKRTLSADYKISSKQIEVMPHFAYPNANHFVPKNSTKAKASLGLCDKKIVLFFGYIRPTKGIEYMLYALPKVIDAVPNVVFSIVGEAQANYVSYLNYLRKLVAELELSDYVRFENHVPEEFLPVTFAASDAVVFPYTSTVGMTPIAHLKAASYGKPIIASNIDNFNKEFMDHENALLVSPKDPDALGKSVIEVFTNDALSKKLSNNITLYCAERSKERAIGDLVKIYQDILERKESK